MRPDHDIMLFGHRQRRFYYQRITAMETTGDVGLIDVQHDFIVSTHLPGAIAFTEIAIEH